LATLLTVTLSDGVMSSWGWRIPFLIAGPLGVIGLYLRLKLQDTPVFTALEEAGEVEESPLRDTLVYAWRPMLLLAGISMITNVGNYILLTYMVNYLQNNLNVGSTTALLVTFIAIVFMMVVIWRVGSLSDRFGRKTMLIAGSVGFIVFSLPAFWLISLGNWITTLLGMLMLALCLVLILGTIPSTLPALFPTEVRYTGFAISYNISVAAFGGTAPFVAGYLADVTGSNYAPAFYLMGIAVVALIPILLSPETARQPLRSGLETPRKSPSEAST
jgi:MFS transporter, MHS family, proline/betaine transporter